MSYSCGPSIFFFFDKQRKIYLKKKKKAERKTNDQTNVREKNKAERVKQHFNPTKNGGRRL